MDVQREARLIALSLLGHKGLLHILPKNKEARKRKLDEIVRLNPRIMERARLAIYARKGWDGAFDAAHEGGVCDLHITTRATKA